ncbi:MAG: glycosyltransferase [Bauldia sp.]
MRSMPQDGGAPSVLAQDSHDAETFDVITIADMTLHGDLGFRIAGECRIQAEAGYRAGLLHVPAGRRRNPPSPDLQRCLRKGIVEIVDPSRKVRARLVVVHAAAEFAELPASLVNVTADRVVIVHDRAPDPERLGRLFGLAIGRMSWAPANRWVRAAIEAEKLAIELEAEDWRPVAGAGLPPERPRRKPAIGYVTGSGNLQWPSAAGLSALLATDGAIDVHVFGRPPRNLLPEGKAPREWIVHAPGDIAADRFLGLVDAILYYPTAEMPVLPDAIIAAALRARKLVLLPKRFEPHFGPGPVYVDAASAPETVRRLLGDDAARTAILDEAAIHAPLRFQARPHRERLSRLAGPSWKARPAAPGAGATRAPRALFVPSNGVGLGHVTRLLAIANRAAGRFEPVFATMAQAVPMAEAYGHPTEYLPSLSDTRADPALWDGWFRTELERLVYAYEADAIVFDGNNPTPGLVRAALAQPPCRLVWVRRGMGNATPSPHLDNARYFDLIVEPGELAAGLDRGPTASRRSEALLVPPIRLLDEPDILPREAAARALGLDPARPSVLIQLGSGSHRDVVRLVDEIVRVLRGLGGVQIAIAEWKNAAAPLSLWPGTTVIGGYPYAQLFGAFDFAIAAAGYNTFHDAIAFGLPTVFIPTVHGAIDDQAARAEFAQNAGAALEVPEDELHHLRTVCEAMLNPAARAVLRRNCLALRTENGAGAAADAIAALLGAA